MRACTHGFYGLGECPECLKEQKREPLPVRSGSAGLNLALAIAKELVCDFSILNHDGNLMKGEHYWVDLDELKDYLEDCIMRNSNNLNETRGD